MNFSGLYKMKRSHYIFYVVMLVLSVILLAMNIIDLFTGGDVQWHNMVLCPIVAVAMIWRLRKANKEKDDAQ